MRALSTLTSLRVLNINACDFENLAGFDRFSALEELHVKENRLTSLIPLDIEDEGDAQPKQISEEFVRAESLDSRASSHEKTDDDGGLWDNGMLLYSGHSILLSQSLRVVDLSSNR